MLGMAPQPHFVRQMPVIMLASAHTAPQLKSVPPEMSTKVMPTPQTAMMEDCSKSTRMLPSVKKKGLETPNTTHKMIINTISPKLDLAWFFLSRF
jgi:hypothetical protein